MKVLRMTPVRLANLGMELEIEWSDGAVLKCSWERLRAMCPCATCRMERERPAVSKPLGLPILTMAEAQPMRPTAMTPAGNYAYGISFSDGHNTGIYAIEYLRELGEGA